MLYNLSSCIGITSHTLLSTSSGFLPTESLWYLNLQSQKSSQSHTLLFLSVCKSNISLELSKLSTVPLPFYFLFIRLLSGFPPPWHTKTVSDKVICPLKSNDHFQSLSDLTQSPLFATVHYSFLEIFSSFAFQDTLLAVLSEPPLPAPPHLSSLSILQNFRIGPRNVSLF